MNNNVDDEWLSYLSQSCEGTEPIKPKMSIGPILTDIPKCEELYISTTTKVIFLNRPVDIANVFWEIPIIDFWLPKIGIIKKQMKMVAHTPDEYEEYRKKLQYINYYKEHIIKHIDNPSARRHKYKDERKLTVGMSKKDIMNCRGKEKNAFYNCFAIILRFIYKGDTENYT